MLRRYKWISYKIMSIANDVISVMITDQSHIRYNFSDDTYIFKASDGYYLVSSSCPEVSTGQCYVRGQDKTCDFSILRFNKNGFKRFEKAVEEYNLKYSTFIID